MADPTEAEAEQGSDAGEESPVITKLRKQSKQAEERAAQLERELAFTRAGLDHLTDKQVRALTAAHEGDITADALKSTADELGFLPKVSGESTPVTDGPDHSAEVSELASLANSPNGAEAPPGRLSQEDIDRKIAEAAAEGGPEAVKDFMLANRGLFDF
jgi:hypothetical protein